MLLAVIDLQHRLLPNRVVVPSLGAGARPADRGGRGASRTGRRLLRAGLGAVVLFAVFLVLALISPSGLGMGDVKLAGAARPLPGLARLGCGARRRRGGLRRPGACVALVLLAARRIGLRGELPFGPAMLLGAALAIGWSDAAPALSSRFRLHSVILQRCVHPLDGPLSAVRVDDPQVARGRLPTASPQPQGRVSRPGPDRPTPSGSTTC